MGLTAAATAPRAAAPEPGAVGERWTSKVAAWLGLGASPGSLLLGAGLAERHGGAVPVVAAVLGLAGITLMLWSQGRLGLRAPEGEDGTLTDLMRSYFTPVGQRLLATALAVAMVGWYGFNVGLGGAALGALMGTDASWLGPVLLGVPCLVLAAGGLRRWNVVGTVATVAALLLVGLVVVRLSARSVPVTTGLDAPGALLADVGAFLGYVAVFGTRAPDFSAHLASRGDLRWCVAALVVPAGLVALAGVGLRAGTGTSDLVGVLAGPDGSALGQVLLAAAVVAPTFTTLYSGSLAVRAAAGIREVPGMVLVSVLGLALAAARFDRQLLPYLTLLAALLPPLVVPMGAEASRRRRGRTPRRVPPWTWLPGSAVAVGLTAAGVGAAPIAGLAIAGAATAVARRRLPRPDR